MKFRAIEQSAQKFPHLLALNVRPVQDEIALAKWLTWHGRGSKTVERLKSIHDMFGLVPEDSAHIALWCNLRGTYWYLESNGQYPVNYGWRAWFINAGFDVTRKTGAVVLVKGLAVWSVTPV